MSTYIVTFNLSQKGLEEINDSPKRVKIDKRINTEFGIDVKHFYKVWADDFDILIVVEAPDAKSLEKSMLTISQRGYAKPTIIQAFKEEEYDEIIDDVSDAISLANSIKEEI